MDRATAIPFVGIVPEVSLWLARAADPSFKANAGDYLGIALQIGGAGSLKLFTKLAKVKGLGKILLTTNREFVNSAVALMTDPSTAEIGVDMLAVKSLEEEGIGDLFIDNTGKESTHNFQFKISYTKSLEKEILSNEELTSKEDFDLQSEVEKRLQKVMDDKKEEIVKALESKDEEE